MNTANIYWMYHVIALFWTLLVCFLFLWLKTLTKACLGRKGFICLILPNNIEGSHGRNSSRNLETGAEAENMEECCLQAGSPRLVQPASLTQSRTICPKAALPTVGLVFPYQSLAKKMPTYMTIVWRQFLLVILLPGNSSLQPQKN